MTLTRAEAKIEELEHRIKLLMEENYRLSCKYNLAVALVAEQQRFPRMHPAKGVWGLHTAVWPGQLRAAGGQMADLLKEVEEDCGFAEDTDEKTPVVPLL